MLFVSCLIVCQSSGTWMVGDVFLPSSLLHYTSTSVALFTLLTTPSFWSYPAIDFKTLMDNCPCYCTWSFSSLPAYEWSGIAWTTPNIVTFVPSTFEEAIKRMSLSNDVTAKLLGVSLYCSILKTYSSTRAALLDFFHNLCFLVTGLLYLLIH